jgi:hypothetical protein
MADASDKYDGNADYYMPSSAVDARGGVIGATLVGFADDGRTPLVLVDESSVAVKAVTLVDLHGAHVGKRVAVLFELQGLKRPVILGLPRDQPSWPDKKPNLDCEVEADGERLIIRARHQLVLQCGAASITLTRAGKVIILGTYISARSSGVMRIKGGSVQLN